MLRLDLHSELSGAVPSSRTDDHDRAIVWLPIQTQSDARIAVRREPASDFFGVGHERREQEELRELALAIDGRQQELEFQPTCLDPNPMRFVDNDQRQWTTDPRLPTSP